MQLCRLGRVTDWLPAYAKDGKIPGFFQSTRKFKTRYATFGFQHEANLNEGHMWPVGICAHGDDRRRRGENRRLVKRAIGEQERQGSRAATLNMYSQLEAAPSSGRQPRAEPTTLASLRDEIVGEHGEKCARSERLRRCARSHPCRGHHGAKSGSHRRNAHNDAPRAEDALGGVAGVTFQFRCRRHAFRQVGDDHRHEKRNSAAAPAPFASYGACAVGWMHSLAGGHRHPLHRYALRFSRAQALS